MPTRETAQWGPCVGSEAEGQALIPFPVLRPSSVPEELKGEGRDREGLPNDVFGVWGKDNPPAVGLDDSGHRGLLGRHTALDELVILQDAAEMREQTEVRE